MGRTEVSCSNTLLLVVLYAPLISFEHFIWILLRGFTIPSGILPAGLALTHFGDHYMRASLTNVLYNSFTL